MPHPDRTPSRNLNSLRTAPAGLSATVLTAAIIAGMTPATDWAVTPAALITPANSTAQIFAGSDYYGVDWVQQYGPPQVVPFFLGPNGIVAAIDRNATDPAGVVVLASGWGAGQTSTALAVMQSTGDPAADAIRLVVLDNNTNRAGGGFWTTYPMLAPLLLTSAAPTPAETTVPVVDTAYEYNINSDAPTYPVNVLADINSLMAYAYGYGGQATAPMPAEALVPVAPGAQHYHYVVAPDGTVVNTYPVDGNITYVTFQSDGLPLLRPVRMVPGGDVIADAVEPAATALVNSGYKDSTPIPRDPGVPRPAALLPPVSAIRATADQLPSAPQDGTAAATAKAPSSTTASSAPARLSLAATWQKSVDQIHSGLTGAVTSSTTKTSTDGG